MLRDNDEYDAGIDCPVCHRSFSTYARLDDHLAEHIVVCRKCRREPAGEEGLCYICRMYGH
jgi:hypothetical protein